MTAKEKAQTSERRRGAPRARPRTASTTGTSSSDAPGKSSHKSRIDHDWNTLLRRLRRWRKRARMALSKLNAVPPAVRTIAIAAVALGVFWVTNFVYHVLRKPTEMFFPVSGALNKMHLAISAPSMLRPPAKAATHNDQPPFEGQPVDIVRTSTTQRRGRSSNPLA